MKIEKEYYIWIIISQNILQSKLINTKNHMYVGMVKKHTYWLDLSLKVFAKKSGKLPF